MNSQNNNGIKTRSWTERSVTVESVDRSLLHRKLVQTEAIKTGDDQMILQFLMKEVTGLGGLEFLLVSKY